MSPTSAAAPLRPGGASPLTRLTLPGDTALGPAAANNENAQIAAGADGYLVVWEDSRSNFTGLNDNTAVPTGKPGGQSLKDIYAARLAADGSLIDTTPIVVHAATWDQTRPRVAWNGQNWLVVWNSNRVAGFTNTLDVLAARVSPAGVVLDPTPIPVDATDSVDERYPTVASDGTDWAVVWFDQGNYFELDGARVAADGSLRDPGGIPLYTPGFPQAPSNPSIAFAGGKYLLTWHEFINNDDDLVGMRLSPTLARLDGTRFTISNAAGYQTTPDVAGNGSDFFVTWHDARLSFHQVYGARVTNAGAVLDPNGINVSGGDAGYPSPRVAWDGAQWIVAWDNYSAGARVARVATDSTVLDAGGVLVSPGAAMLPDVAGMPGGGARVVWTDLRAPGFFPTDVYGGSLSAAGSPGPATVVSTGAPAQRQVRLVANGSGYISVFVSQVSGETRIKAQRLDAAGNALDTEPILVAGDSALLSNPAVAWDGTRYLVVWENGTGPGATVYGRRLAADGTLLDAAPFAVMPGNTPDVAALDGTFLVADTHEPTNHQRFPKVARVRGSDGVVLDSTPITIGSIFAVLPRVIAFGNRWLVVWEKHPTHDNPAASITGNFVNADGSIGTAFSVANTGYTPAPATNGDGSQALIAFHNYSTSDVYAQRMLANGTLLDGTSGIRLTTAPNQQLLPAVGWDGSEYVVAYDDYRAFNTLDKPISDLYGTRVTEGGVVLDPSGFALANGPAAETGASVAGGNGTVLVAFSNLLSAPPYGAYRVQLEVLGANVTPTARPTDTVTATATPRCGPTGDYGMTVSSGASIVPGTTDIGLHCNGECRMAISLPFAFQLYDRSFTTVNVSANGVLQFASNVSDLNNYCLPQGNFNYAIMPLWDFQSLAEPGDGVFTSVSGQAPNRIFNIEWRSSPAIGGVGHYEARLYENSAGGQFDLVYGEVTYSGSATIGAQRANGSSYTQYLCNTYGLAAGTQVRFELPVCSTPATASATATGAAATATGAAATASATATGAAATATGAAATASATQAAASATATGAAATATGAAATMTGVPTAAGTTATATQVAATATVPASATGVPATRTGTAVPPTAATTGTVTAVSFSDVPVGSTFYPYIMCLSGRSIISGYSDGTFRPSNTLTRGQLAKIVAGAAGLTAPPSGQTFSDVPPGGVFYPMIETLAQHGIIGGYDCGGAGEPCDSARRPYFRPAAAVTRGQIAKIVIGAAGLSAPPVGQTFADVPPSHPFYRWIEQAAAQGILSGYTCGGDGEPCDAAQRPYFRSGNSATRGQAAKIVGNTFLPNCAPR